MVYHSDVVKVTSEDIENGERQCAKSCAVALAVEKTFSNHYGLSQVVQQNGEIELTDKTTNKPIYHLKVSDNDLSEIARFVDEFDGGYDVEPFEFSATLREGGV
tara:strand:- start:2393 stop:2704 length:312 start_codon:yes stop_codon:yes gene_type:complete